MSMQAASLLGGSPSDGLAEVFADYPLAPWCSVRVGGSAELFVRPKAPQVIVDVLRVTTDRGLPFTVLGGGANTLVGDGGVPGVTLKLPGDLCPEEVRADEGGAWVTLPAGASIARLIQRMRSGGWVGAEFLAGIPGTLGGAVTMNAGTKMGECMSVVDAVELATADGIGWLPRRALAVEYRHTALPALSVVTRVRFRLPLGDVARSEAAMEADLAYRKRTQPLSQPNFGSVFKNPPGEHAGRLIEQVGLKGHVVGGAQISALHANWIVNLGAATAMDVVALMGLAQTRVKEATGFSLEPEVKRVGRFL
jgi:UDP-N-acetylmuramate dehydrogenase